MFVWKFRKVALTQVPTGKAGLIPVGGLPTRRPPRWLPAGPKYGDPVGSTPELQLGDLATSKWDMTRSQNWPGRGGSPRRRQRHLQVEIKNFLSTSGPLPSSAISNDFEGSQDGLKAVPFLTTIDLKALWHLPLLTHWFLDNPVVVRGVVGVHGLQEGPGHLVGLQGGQTRSTGKETPKDRERGREKKEHL